MKVVEVELCMGSSCFARGNAQALAHLESYITARTLTDRVQLSGHLCLGTCSSGPNIRIGGQVYQQVNPETVVSLLERVLGEQEALDG